MKKLGLLLTLVLIMTMKSHQVFAQSVVYALNNTNTYNASFDSNIISSSQWNALENAGAVFLPTAGVRYGTSVYDVDSCGSYWSASGGDIIFYCDDCADFFYVSYEVYFTDSFLSTNLSNNPGKGNAVRLVRNAQ